VAKTVAIAGNVVERKKTRELPPRPLRVLACVTTTRLSKYFTALQSETQIDLLPIALISALPVPIRSGRLDAIVIATEEFDDTVWQSSSVLRELFSATPTLLLASELNPSLRRRAARFHIHSTLPLNVSTDQLLAAISATVAGLAVTLEVPSLESNENTVWTQAKERTFDEPFVEHLTVRETVVLRLLAVGHSNKEIASRLKISEHTVKFHVSSVLAKLGAFSRTEAVSIGIMRGLIAI